MTPELLAELARYPAFPPSAATLIHVAGLDAAARLIGAWPGQDVPMPKAPGGSNDASRRLWQRLVDIVGADAAARLVLHYTGDDMLVPNLKIVATQRAHERIRIEFDALVAEGISGRVAVFELGIKHHLSRKAVEKVLKSPSLAITPATMPSAPAVKQRKLTVKPIDEAQGSLF
jgi:hypothetical protein